MIEYENFIDTLQEGIMIGTDDQMKQFARDKFKYESNKGLDFIAKKNNKFLIGETKFLTDI